MFFQQIDSWRQGGGDLFWTYFLFVILPARFSVEIINAFFNDPSHLHCIHHVSVFLQFQNEASSLLRSFAVSSYIDILSHTQSVFLPGMPPSWLTSMCDPLLLHRSLCQSHPFEVYDAARPECQAVGDWEWLTALTEMLELRLLCSNRVTSWGKVARTRDQDLWYFGMFWLDTGTRHLQRLKLRNICVCSWACAVDTSMARTCRDSASQFVLWVGLAVPSYYRNRQIGQKLGCYKLNLRSTSQCWWWPLLTSMFGFPRLWISTADKDWSDVVLHESAWSVWMHCSIREWVFMCSDTYS